MAQPPSKKSIIKTSRISHHLYQTFMLQILPNIIDEFEMDIDVRALFRETLENLENFNNNNNDNVSSDNYNENSDNEVSSDE